MFTDIEVTRYEEAEQFLLDTPRFTTKNPIEATKGFYHFLTMEQLEKKVVHIAGTNGKGSVCAYLNSILLKNGQKVGMFTSPHLVTMRERFRINGEPVGEKDFLQAFLWVRHRLHDYQTTQTETEKKYEPTFFEMLFFMGWYIFSENNVDILLLETGLGGKLDATNVTTSPLLTIITEIGLDHMQYLGNTIAAIAGEKAGIIKQNVPVVYEDLYEDKKDAAEVIASAAKKNNSTTYCLMQNVIKLENIKEKSIDFSMVTRYYDYIRLTLSTPALYQVENAALAVYACEALQDVFHGLNQEFTITKEAVTEGIHSMYWEARMEEVLPGVYIDGGHNHDGVKAFLQTVESRVEHQVVQGKNILLFSAVSDKAHADMIHMIAESKLFQEIIVTSIPGARGISAEELSLEFSNYTSNTIQILEDVTEAWNTCCEHKGDKDTVYVAGSLYLAGLIKGLL